MKIAFVGNFEVDYSSENHHAKSLRALGNEVIQLQEQQVTTDEIFNVAKDCDVLIWIHTHNWRTVGFMSIQDLFRILKKLNVITLTYHLDLWLGLKREEDLHNDPFYKEIGHFFATDKLMADWFNDNTEVKGHYIPAGVYDKEVYISDVKEHPAKNDVIFVGSKEYHPEWPYRPRLVNWLSDTYQDKFNHIGGSSKFGTVRGDDLNRLYAASKIAVGDTLCINYDYPYYFSDRLFESTGRGAFTIFPYIKGIEDNFEIGKEIVTYEFNNFDDLKDKIDYYLQNDLEREAIRQAGNLRTKNNYTYLHRWQVILERIKDDTN
jgi:hypothetical protein